MPREVIICARFTKEEAEKIDAIRKSLTRSMWVRWVILRALRAEES